MKLLFVLLSSLQFLFPVFSEELSSFEFEIEALVREGNIVAATEKVNSSSLNKIQKSKFLGLIKLKEKRFEEAQSLFETYLDSNKEDHRIRSFYIQSLMQTKNFAKASRTLELTPAKKRDLKWSLLYSMALWEKGQKKEALDFLASSKEKFKSILIPRQSYFFLAHMGLFETLIKESQTELQNKTYGAELGLYVVKLLKDAKENFRADKYFEFLSALFATDAEVLKERGIYEIERKRLTSGAEFLAKASLFDPKYAYESAEAFLRLGNFSRALFYNQKVQDQQKKITQLFSIYVQSEDYQKAGGLYLNLVKQDGFSNQKVAYAMTYVSFKIKDDALFNKSFEKVTDPSLYSKALVLKKKIEDCKTSEETQCEFI